jgi:tetratricopeptide (TPR) repeat protein
MLRLLQSPRAGHIYHSLSLRDRFRYKSPRRFMRRSEEKQLHTLPFQLRPRERPQRIASVARQLWKHLRQIGRAITSAFALQQQGLLQSRMAFEKTGQLQAGQEALRIRQDIGDRRGEAETLGNLVILSWRLSRYPDALRDGHRALAIWREIGDQRGASEALSNIATVQSSVGDSTKALGTAAEALDISEGIGDDSGIAFALAVLSNTYRKLARYPEALDRAEQALAIRRQTGDLHGEVHPHQ